MLFHQFLILKLQIPNKQRIQWLIYNFLLEGRGYDTKYSVPLYIDPNSHEIFGFACVSPKIIHLKV